MSHCVSEPGCELFGFEHFGHVSGATDANNPWKRFIEHDHSTSRLKLRKVHTASKNIRAARCQAFRSLCSASEAQFLRWRWN